MLNVTPPQGNEFVLDDFPLHTFSYLYVLNFQPRMLHVSPLAAPQWGPEGGSAANPQVGPFFASSGHVSNFSPSSGGERVCLRLTTVCRLVLGEESRGSSQHLLLVKSLSLATVVMSPWRPVPQKARRLLLIHKEHPHPRSSMSHKGTVRDTEHLPSWGFLYLFSPILVCFIAAAGFSSLLCSAGLQRVYLNRRH